MKRLHESRRLQYFITEITVIGQREREGERGREREREREWEGEGGRESEREIEEAAQAPPFAGGAGPGGAGRATGSARHVLGAPGRDERYGTGEAIEFKLS